jgi:CubicO group peptidase (beta-lactamase class C family)
LRDDWLRATDAQMRGGGLFLLLCAAACGSSDTQSAPAPDDSPPPAPVAPPPDAPPAAPDPISLVENGLAGGHTIAERMKNYAVPGVSIAVIDHDAVAWAKGYGVLDTTTKKPVMTSSVFQACSISKSLSATATLKLVEGGKIALDDDVGAHLTSWKVPDDPLLATQKPTIRRILSHSAGFNVHGFLGYPVAGPVPTLIQILDGVPPSNVGEPIHVVYEPGSKTQYSGGGISVLEQMLVDVAQTPYPDLLRTTVLAPLGMTSSSYAEPLDASLATDASSGHDVTGAVVNGVGWVWPTHAAGSLWTTPSDLAKFVIEIELSARGAANHILTKDTVTTMLSVANDGIPSDAGQVGLGVILGARGGQRYFWHNGAHAGFQTFYISFPSKGVGAVIFTNGDNGADLIDEIEASIAKTYHWPGS